MTRQAAIGKQAQMPFDRRIGATPCAHTICHSTDLRNRKCGGNRGERTGEG
jgi:hypothetical protein